MRICQLGLGMYIYYTDIYIYIYIYVYICKHTDAILQTHVCNATLTFVEGAQEGPTCRRRRCGSSRHTANRIHGGNKLTGLKGRLPSNLPVSDQEFQVHECLWVSAVAAFGLCLPLALGLVPVQVGPWEVIGFRSSTGHFDDLSFGLRESEYKV